MGLSVLFSIYFFEFEQGVIQGGGLERTLQKLFFFLTFTFSLRRFLDVRTFMLNMAVKLPLIFLIVFSFVGSLTFLEGSYVQAINIVFFFPVLFINWNKPGGDELYRYILKVITFIVVVQLIMDPVLKAYTGVRWDNNALVGGMGNPNVYGLFLLVSAGYLYLFSKSFLRILSVPLALSATLTGSLVCALLAVLLALMIIISYFIRSGYLGKSAMILLIVPLVGFLIAFSYNNSEEILGLLHVISKIEGLFSLTDEGQQIGSVDGRLDYAQEGLNLMIDNPISMIVGHPNFLPMFNGDGTWISFIVTHGILFTLLFQLSNLYLILRGARFPQLEFLFSVIVLIMFQAFFITNRILDYWPAGFVYLMVFSYCATRRVCGINARF